MANPARPDRRTHGETPPLPGPLEGIRVVSLAEQYPGPYATLLLADLGADVTLIERPGGGDPARVYPDFFASLARNKRSVALDLKSVAGLRELRALIETCDVMLEGFRPGTAARLGFDYESVKAINPRLIYVSISGFGQTGPYRDRVGHDLSYQAIAGFLFDQAGRCASPPLISLGDLAGAMFAAFGITTALYARERTGLGTFVDVSMTDGLVSWMTSFLGPALNDGNALPVHDIPTYGSFGCADGRILTLSIAHEDHFWRKLCELLALDDVSSCDFSTRLARGDELRTQLRSEFVREPLDHWADLFDTHGIPWSPLNDLEAVIGDPHFRDRGMFKSVARADGTREHHVMQPVRFSAFGSALRRAAPRLGEHGSWDPTHT